MRGEDLLRDIGYISDDLIEEAMEDCNAKEISGRINKGYKLRKWGSIAACAAVLGISATAIWIHSNKKLEEIPMQNESSFNTAVSEDTMAFEEERVHNTIVDTEDNKFQENNTILDAAMPEADLESAGIKSEQEYNDNAAELTVESAADSKKQSSEKDLGQDDICGYPRFENTEYTIIDDFPPKQPAPDNMENALIRDDYCYKMPDKGTYFYYQKLQAAIAYYCGQENNQELAESADMPIFAFQVAIDIFGDQIIPTAEEDVNQQHEEKSQSTENSNSELEYQYALLNQSDDGKKLLEQEYQRLIAAGYQVALSEDYKLTGLLTKEELDNFQVSPEYGYVFRFVDE